MCAGHAVPGQNDFDNGGLCGVSTCPVMVGEWSGDAVSPAPHELSPDERGAYFRTLGAAQLEAWGPTVVAWTYWSYKMLIDTPASDVWDLGKAIELGLFPAEVRP